MKKILLALAITLGIAGSAFAQTNANSNCRRNADAPAQQCRQGECPQASNLFEGLNLTPEQQTALEAIQNQCRDNARENRDSVRENREQRREQQREARLQQRRDCLSQIKAVLTPEQYVTFLENAFVNAPGKNKAPKMEGRDRRGNGDRRQQPACRRQQPAAEAAQPATR